MKIIVQSILIAVGVILVATILGTLISFLFYLFIFIDHDSARYYFSAMAQSLAALFALTFIVINLITSFASKNLAKHVFRYVFSRKLSLTTIALFVFSIIYNLIYLSFIKEGGHPELIIFDYTSGFIASIIIFIVSMVLLVLYAHKTYSVSVNPFDYFYDEIFKSIPNSLQSLKIFLDNRLLFEDLIQSDKFQFWPAQLCENQQLVEYNAKAGYVTHIDINSVRMAIDILENQLPLHHLVRFGDKIRKGIPVFAFNNINEEQNKRIIGYLSKAINVKDNKPGWVAEFEYITPMFEVIKNQFMNISDLKNYVDKLRELGEFYVSNRYKFIGEFDEKLREFNYYELLDYWFDEYYELIKQGCIVKSEMIREGKILGEGDEPDIYIMGGLHRLIAFLYEKDAEIYFKKAVDNVTRYSVISAKTESSSFELNHIHQLSHIVRNISYITQDEVKLNIPLNKFLRYCFIVFEKYLRIFKPLSEDANNYSKIIDEYNRLHNYFVKNIKIKFNKSVGEDYIKVMEKIKICLLSLIFSSCVNAITNVNKASHFEEIFRSLHLKFWKKYLNVRIDDNNGRWHYASLEKILEQSYRDISELSWFGNVMDMDDSFKEDKPWTDTEVKTREYCYYVYFLTIVGVNFKVDFDRSYWLRDNNIMSLQHFFDKFKNEVSKPNYGLQHILDHHAKKYQINQNDILSKLQSIINDISSIPA